MLTPSVEQICATDFDAAERHHTAFSYTFDRSVQPS